MAGQAGRHAQELRLFSGSGFCQDREMITCTLVIALTLLGALSVLQILAAAGLPVGKLMWGGTHRVLPTKLRIGSVVAVILYCGFAVLLLSRAGVLGGGDTLTIKILSWILFAYLVLSVLANAASKSQAERWTMAPVSAVLAAATLVIALG